MQAVLYKPVGATEQVGKELAMQTIEAAIWFLGFALGMELLGVASNSFITAGGIGTLVFTFAGKEVGDATAQSCSFSLVCLCLFWLAIVGAPDEFTRVGFLRRPRPGAGQLRSEARGR
jgi:hypothetical protein